jgi:DNA-binding CsgD family transcriptional regulator
LILEGSPGIGKTTLWLAGLDLARGRGYRVLASRAAESEARLSYTALGDLFAGVLDEALPGLPPPQARALRAALLQSEGGGSPDQRAVSLASVNVVRTLAMAGPLVVAVDDVQWLDTPSARVLSFVLRRLSDEPVGLLLSLRVGAGSAGDPLDAERALADVVRIPVGPLGVDPLGRVLREQTGTDLPRPVVVRLHRVSHGNPLFALEIARAVVRQGVRPEPGKPLPVPGDLQQLLSARLAALPSSARAPLLAISALSHPTVELVLAAVADDDAEDGLARAEAMGIIERSDGRVRFSHPLLGSTVYVNASPRERRDLHVRLGELMADPEERARHLALGTDGPDQEVAGALEEAARHARTRGAPDAAAELVELARQLTPPRDRGALRRRSLEASEYHFDAGDAARALAVLEETIASAPPGPDRAEMLYRLASMSWMNLIHGVRVPAEQALEEAGEDPELRSAITHALAWVAFYLGDLQEADEQTRRALNIANDVADPATRADALAARSFVEFLLGEPASRFMSEALKLQDAMMVEGSWTEGSVYTTPRSILGLQLMWSGRLDEARKVLEQELAEYEKRGMYTVRQEVLCYLAELESRVGRWHLAREYAAEAMETVVESGQTATQSHVVLFNQAYAAAHLGLVEEARQMATDGVRLALSNDDLFNANWNRAVLGFLELSLSDHERANEHLEPVVRYLERMGSVEPAIIPCLPDEAEALIALGQLGPAQALIERLEEQGRAVDRPWARAVAARCRGLLSAAGGNLDAARIDLERALEEHERVGQPFERARSLLVLGQIRRRAKQKRLARASLEEAGVIFAELGATLWAERAVAELARIGGRPPTPLELTPTEVEVARRVADGHTNREVADALFMSPGTVQANLKRIYRKLGVRSRTELAARLDRTATTR